MTTAKSSNLRRAPSAHTALAFAATAWFITAASGQIFFAAYMAGFYGPTVVTGDFVQWTRNQNLVQGYGAGDPWGNLGFISHVTLAFVITLAGIAQLVPDLRRRAPMLHRYTGRVFIVGAIGAALGGIALVWIRGAQTSLNEALAISLNGALVLVSAAMALRAALKRNIPSHQAWAFRLWLLVGGVWFLRVGMAAGGIVAVGAFGLPQAVLGDMFAIWSWGCFLVPLAVYQIYRQVRATDAASPRLAMAALLALATLLTAGGIVGMAIGQWVPLMMSEPL